MIVEFRPLTKELAMPTDRYTKTMLTVIAAALVALWGGVHLAVKISQ